MRVRTRDNYRHDLHMSADVAAVDKDSGRKKNEIRDKRSEQSDAANKPKQPKRRQIGENRDAKTESEHDRRQYDCRSNKHARPANGEFGRNAGPLFEFATCLESE